MSYNIIWYYIDIDTNNTHVLCDRTAGHGSGSPRGCTGARRTVVDRLRRVPWLIVQETQQLVAEPLGVVSGAAGFPGPFHLDVFPAELHAQRAYLLGDLLLGTLELGADLLQRLVLHALVTVVYRTRVPQGRTVPEQVDQLDGLLSVPLHGPAGTGFADHHHRRRTTSVDVRRTRVKNR